MLATLTACVLGGVGIGVAGSSVVARRLWCRHASQLARLAAIDPLTGLANRRVLERLDVPGAAIVCDRIGDGTEVEAAEGELPVAWVAYLDVDRFKCVNDHHGHAAGDLLLRWVANLLRASVRPGDLVIRAGGDEFILVLVGCTITEATDVVARVQAGLATAVHGCTLSVGLSALEPEGARVAASSGSAGSGQLARALGAADAALVEAKLRRPGSVVVAASHGVSTPVALSPVVGSGEVRGRWR